MPKPSPRVKRIFSWKSVPWLISFISAFSPKRVWGWLGDVYLTKDIIQSWPQNWRIEISTLQIILFVVGLGGLLVIAFWPERRFPRHAQEPLAPATLPKPLELPALRPKIIPIRWDKSPDGYHGLFVRNDGEPGFDISIEEPVTIGTAKLDFWNKVHSGLTKEDGEFLFDAHIRLSQGSGTTGGALREEMVKANVEEIDLKIKYRDLEHSYVTTCKLVRDFWGTGIRITAVQQQMLASFGQAEQYIEGAPKIVLHFDKPPEAGVFPGLGITRRELMVENIGDTDAFNVQIEDVCLDKTGRVRASFSRINHLRKHSGIVKTACRVEGTTDRNRDNYEIVHYDGDLSQYWHKAGNDEFVRYPVTIT